MPVGFPHVYNAIAYIRAFQAEFTEKIRQFSIMVYTYTIYQQSIQHNSAVSWRPFVIHRRAGGRPLCVNAKCRVWWEGCIIFVCIQFCSLCNIPSPLIFQLHSSCHEQSCGLWFGVWVSSHIARHWSFQLNAYSAFLTFHLLTSWCRQWCVREWNEASPCMTV